MTDKEIFEKYCDEMMIKPNINPKFDYILEATLSYKLFKLQIAIQGLKQSAKDSIIEIFLTIKGRII